MKKKWQKPKLVVLVKGRPEEFVLTGCKYTTRGTNGPRGYDNDGCYYSGRACSAMVRS